MLNNMGEIIPPCLTPLPTRKSGEVELPHRTHTSGVYTRKAAI